MLLIGVLSLVWLSMQLVVLEMIITKVGKMFVETEIFQQESKQTLDGLSDGLIIIEKESSKVMFANKAAIKMQEICDVS